MLEDIYNYLTNDRYSGDDKCCGIPKLIMACIKQDINYFKYLINNGANINIVSDEGFTPITSAIYYNNNKEIFDILIQNKVEIDFVDKVDYTPLMYGIMFYFQNKLLGWEILILLVGHAKKINLKTTGHLSHKNLNSVDFLLEYLFLGYEDDNYKVLKLFVAHKAKISDYGQNLLIKNSQNKKYGEIIQILQNT
jgi:ankyrin repeat protein